MSRAGDSDGQELIPCRPGFQVAERGDEAAACAAPGAGSCPDCGEVAATAPGKGAGCGSFLCLYRRHAGAPPSTDVGPRRPFPWSDPMEVARVAVVRPGQLGDLLLAIPGLRALRKGFPRAEITLVAQYWALDLPRRFPWLDRVQAVDSPHTGWSEVASPFEADPLLREARGHGYDLVLQLHGDGVQAARFALALGGRATAGFCRDWQVGREFHLLLPMLWDEPEVLRGLRLADAVGGQPEGVDLEFPALPEDAEELEQIPGLAEALERRPVAALHVGARAPARRWPAARWVEMAQGLWREWGATLVMVGGADESPLVERVVLDSGGPALNLAGKLTLGGLAALLRRVDLFVGNDSGPAQLASAVAPRSLRIFGPANRRRWAPLDISRHRIVYRQAECSPCDHWECPIDHRCLRQVSVEQVMAEVEVLLEDSDVLAGVHL